MTKSHIGATSSRIRCENFNLEKIMAKDKKKKLDKKKAKKKELKKGKKKAAKKKALKKGKKGKKK